MKLSLKIKLMALFLALTIIPISMLGLISYKMSSSAEEVSAMANELENVVQKFKIRE